MAAKVTQQDITDAGFRPEQFGMPADWFTTDPPSDPPTLGYLDRLIFRAQAWALGRYGQTYNEVAADTPAYERLRSAELCWVSGHLWKRRAAFIDSNAVSSHDNMIYLDRREFEAQAERAFACAEENMALAIGGETVSLGSGAALTSVETGPYAPRHYAYGARLP